MRQAPSDGRIVKEQLLACLVVPLDRWQREPQGPRLVAMPGNPGMEEDRVAVLRKGRRQCWIPSLHVSEE